MNIKRNQEDIRRLLMNYEYLRDDDAKLVCNIWAIQLDKMGINIKDISGVQAFELIANGKLSPSDSITRCRRKLQEVHPELRGKKWKERHLVQEEVKNQLFDW
jgi:hypothetical protein